MATEKSVWCFFVVVFFFLICLPFLDNQIISCILLLLKIELLCKQNKFSITVLGVFFVINLAYLSPWQQKFLCYGDVYS